MSKQTSKKAQLQRFSGPELSELLELVASEHGPTAAIAAVNKVRSGGVAGFFCREEFEVVVDLRGSAKRAAFSAGKSADQPAKRKQAPKPARPSKPVKAVEPAQADVADQPIEDPPPITPTIDLASAEPTPQTDQIQTSAGPQIESSQSEADDLSIDASVDASIDLSDPADGPQEQTVEPVFGGPRPEAIDGTHAGFVALLQSRLAQTPPEESPLAGRRAPQTPTESAGPPSVDQLSKPAMPAPGIAPLEAQDPERFSLLESEPNERTGFWRQLQEIEAELSGFMPVPSAFIATIGPLSLTTPIVRRLQTQPGFESADVIALTNRAEIVSEPDWELVRSGNQLIEEAEGRGDRPTILMIDVPVELPNWVAPLQSHLRMAGVGLFRYAVPGAPDADKLDEYRLASDVPYVLDLISRSGAADLVDFIAQRHPIATVAGADMTPELLLALRKQVGLGL